VTSLHSIIEECFILLKASADNKDISLTSSVPESFTAYFDEVTIHTVFRNIISNAIKFTPRNGKIHISGYISQGYVTVCFKDSGKGIPEHVIHKIMVQNQHYTSLGTDNEQGTGLGLVMIKDFVSKNNGKLNISSKEGEGTEVLVALPLNKPSQEK
jgi:signal transduction histidine kinase